MKSRNFIQKIKSKNALAKTLKTLRARKKKIVFTNGCFDLLHPGHVHYLSRAKSEGDILVVALNSDSSVKEIKGPLRPINSLKDRLQVMAALESVDFVTWFEEDTPLKTILALKPHLIVKGGDWKVDQMVGSQEVKAWGGKAKSLPFIPGKSTTNLINKMK